MVSQFLVRLIVSIIDSFGRSRYVILLFRMRKLSLSVFFPTYNEEANIKRTVVSAVRVLRGLRADYEVLIIDDGSKDKTGEVADRLAKGDKRIRVIHHRPNRGYGGALISGFYNARKELIAFSDGDGQFDFAEVTKFLPLLSENDMVIGYRIKRAEGWKRQLIAQALRVWDLIFFGIWFKDIDCAFKIIKKRSLAKLSRLKTNTAMINTELLVKAEKAGLKIAEVPVTHLADRGDKKRREGGGHPRIILRAVKGTFDLKQSLRGD